MVTLGMKKIKGTFNSTNNFNKINLLTNETNSELISLKIKINFKEPMEICDLGSVLRKGQCGNY